MDIIKTKSFELSVYRKGNEDSEYLVLCLPGKLDTKDYAHMEGHVEFLSSKGFLAVSFDPAGTWESPGSIEQYSLTNYIKSVGELVEYFEKKTILVGHSFGGTTAGLAATKFEGVIGFVSLMGRGHYVGENLKWKESGVKVSSRDDPKSSEERKFELKYSFFEDSKKYDSLDYLKNCDKPKLFIAGKDDELISADEVKRIFELSKEPKEFEVIDWDHDYRNSEEMIKIVNNLILEFIEKYLS